MGEFTHTDSWRVLRIQSEIVHGINALAELGAAVSVFGSARLNEDHPYYQQAREMGKALVDAGFAVITGGGPGLMEAANRGAPSRRAASRSGSTSSLPSSNEAILIRRSPSTSVTSSPAR